MEKKYPVSEIIVKAEKTEYVDLILVKFGEGIKYVSEEEFDKRKKEVADTLMGITLDQACVRFEPSDAK